MTGVLQVPCQPSDMQPPAAFRHNDAPPMNLRPKIIALIAAVFVLLGAAQYVIGERILLPSFTELERQSASNEMARALHALDREIDLLYVVGEDWGDWAETYAYLREREQPTETYFESWATVRLPQGEAVPALVFLSDLTHPQWAGDLGFEVQAQLIAGASGLSGRNVDYLRDLVLHLHEEGVADRMMERLLARVEALEAEAEAA